MEPKGVQKSPEKTKSVTPSKQEGRSPGKASQEDSRSPEKPKLETKASVKEIHGVRNVESPVKPSESATKTKSSDGTHDSSKVEANGEVEVFM